MITKLKAARQLRSWTQADVIDKVATAAMKINARVAEPASLRVQLSGWENGRKVPDKLYRLLLCTVYDCSAEQLGLSGGEELSPSSGRPGSHRIAPSDSMLSYFEDQLSALPALDNQNGPVPVRPLVAAICEQLDALDDADAPALGLLTARFEEFAGWLAQDSGDDNSALRHTDKAAELAMLSGDVKFTIYTAMRRSSILTGLGELGRAHALGRYSVHQASQFAPELLPVSLRQYALLHAKRRDERATKVALHRAIELSSDSSIVGPTLSPYCTTEYVQMEAALSLLHLGDARGARDACLSALRAWPSNLVRDKALCLARLSMAHAELRELDAAADAGLATVKQVTIARSARAVRMLSGVARRLEGGRRLASVRLFNEALATVV